MPHRRKTIRHCLGNVRGHAQTRVEVDTQVTNNGGQGNSGRPHAERNVEFGTAYGSKRTKGSLSWLDSVGAYWSTSTGSPQQHTQKPCFEAQELQREWKTHRSACHLHKGESTDTIRYDTIGEFNVDWKAEYSALSSTRSQKKKLKQPTPVPL